MRDGENAESVFIPNVSVADEIGPYLSAMANSKGGKVFVGVDLKNYHLTGSKKDQQWFENITQEFCRPKPNMTIKTVEKNEKLILVLELSNNESKPYYFKNTCYVMDGHKPKVALAEKQSLVEQIQELDTKLNPVVEDLSTAISEEEAAQINSITDELIEIQNEDDLDDDIVVSSESAVSPLSSSDIEVVDADALNERQRKALEVISQESSIRNKKYRQLFGVSHKTAHLELIDLVEKGYIKSTGAGRSTCYVSAR
jgi:predicted HTH transcriptional regulator